MSRWWATSERSNEGAPATFNVIAPDRSTISNHRNSCDAGRAAEEWSKENRPSDLPTGRCASCRHWIAPTSESDGHYGTCAAAGFWGDHSSQWGDRSRDGTPFGEATTPPILAQDGEDYYATVRCADTFGCILWAPAESGQS